jgi:branched-chain amino acid transport system ATP-binding protein
VSALLHVENLVARYGRITALKGISLQVEEGEIVALIGANGAGKTTTLRAISGFVRPASGRIVFDGHDLRDRAPHAVVRLGIGHAPEGRRIFPRMTVRENLELGAYARSSRREVAADTEAVLTTFPRLRERLAQRAGTMSGGEQQMLAIGRALMGRPRLLLLDEPSLGLSPLLVQTIFGVIREISARGTTILLIEQNATQALAVATRGYVLEVGSVVYEGRSADLTASPAVQAAYLGGGGGAGEEWNPPRSFIVSPDKSPILQVHQCWLSGLAYGRGS